jgi:hypothetical protein
MHEMVGRTAVQVAKCRNLLRGSFMAFSLLPCRQWLAELHAAGARSLRAIAAALNERGIPTAGERAVRRRLALVGCGKHDARRALALFNSVQVTVRTICGIGIVCAQARIETEQRRAVGADDLAGIADIEVDMRVILRRLLANALELAAANAHDRRADFIMKLRITFHLQRAAPINDARVQSAPRRVASIAPRRSWRQVVNDC